MATAAPPFSSVYELDRNHSSFELAVRHLELSTFRASFADVDARLSATDGGVEIEGHVRADSISIVDPDFRAHVVHGADFLGADAHPLLTFRSRNVALGDDRTLRMSGELTIRGVSRPVTVTGTYSPPVTDPFGLTRAALELKTTIDRRDWGMEWQAALPDGGEALGWDVEVTAHIELVQQA